MNEVDRNLAAPADAAIDRRGLLAAATAFTIWGVFPAYWHLLKAVPSMQIMAHRVVWSAVLVVGWLLWRQGWDWWRTIAARPRMLAALALSGAVIAFNWGLYIWAVNAGHVVETSLGYFINPLVTVALGVIVLRERLRRLQWIAVACAAAGVAWLAWSAGSPPWIALGLAGSFALYGLLRKLVPVDAVAGLGVESLFLFLPALAYLLWAEAGPGGGFAGVPRRMQDDPALCDLLCRQEEPLGDARVRCARTHGADDDIDVVQPVLFAMQAEGRNVSTIESIGTHDKPSDFQNELIAGGAVQCGYCIPGMIMSAEALMKAETAFDDEIVKEYMDGNLCRCGTYQRVRAAIKDAAGMAPAAAKA